MRRCVGLVSAVSSAALLAWAAGSVSAGAPTPGSRAIALFPDTMTAADWAQVARNPEWAHASREALANSIDFASAPTVWNGDGGQGASGQAARASLTYSFPADGTNWSLGASSGPNALNAAFTSTFGAGNADLGREYVRQAMAAWKRVAGVTFTEVADNGSDFDTATPRNPDRGDIRIGGIPLGTGANPVAASNLPASGGDISFNTSFFIPANLAAPANSFRYLRNAAGHEIGTALGLLNVVPCDGTKLMEGQVNTGFDGPQIDDRRGIQSAYGDRFSGNNAVGTAPAFGNLFNPINRSVRINDLSTNGAAGPNATGEDWFGFQTTVNFQDLVVTATPTGGTYNNGAQGGSPCTGSTTSVNASQAGKLNIELRNQAGDTVIQTAVGVAGVPTVLTRIGHAPGFYTLRIVDVGPNPAGNQTVQTYDLSLVVTNYFATPYANAGVSKRIASGETCYFMGDINSRATQPGATITAYDWDLDGNGSFETLNQPRPTFVYNADGTFPVSLRVTDSNGRIATDTISVVVFGSTTGVAWRNIPNATSPRTGTAPGSEPGAGGAAWNSGGPWQTFDLVVEGRTGALLNGINLGADGAPYQLNVNGSIFNHPSGSNTRTFNFETILAALFFDTYACYGGGVNTDGQATQFAGTTNLTGAGGVIKATTFTQPAAALTADATAPSGGSIRVLRVTVNGTLGGPSVADVDSRIELGLPNGLTRVYTIPMTALPSCPGDTDGDGDIDFIDLNRVLSAFGTMVGHPNYIAGADLDDDGDVDFIDLNEVLSFFGTSCALADSVEPSRLVSETWAFGADAESICAGDVNRDGFVSFADLNAVLSSLGAVASGGVSAADLNADGVIDAADVNEVLNNYAAVR